MNKKRFTSYLEKGLNKKRKATLLIYLIISLSFFIQSSKEADAQNTQVCCEKTKAGDYCLYTDRNNCDTSNNLRFNNDRCERTTFCSNICCVSI